MIRGFTVGRKPPFTSMLHGDLPLHQTYTLHYLHKSSFKKDNCHSNQWLGAYAGDNCDDDHTHIDACAEWVAMLNEA